MNSDHTFTSCDDWNISWLAANVKNDGLLNPWNKKMGSFSHNLILDSSESVKNNSSLTTIHCRKEQGRIIKLIDYFQKTKQTTETLMSIDKIDRNYDK